MPPSTNADRTIPGDGDLVEPQTDAISRQLARLIGAVAIAAAMVGGLEALFGLAFGEARAVVLGLSAVTYAAWLTRVSLRFGDLRQAETIGQIAAVTLVLVAMAAILEPELAFAMAIASLLPIVLVLPFLGSRAIGQILVIGGIVGLGSVVAGELLPRGDRLPAALSASIASMTLVLVYGFLLIFLWEVTDSDRQLTRGLADHRLDGVGIGHVAGRGAGFATERVDGVDGLHPPLLVHAIEREHVRPITRQLRRRPPVRFHASRRSRWPNRPQTLRCASAAHPKRVRTDQAMASRF